MSDRDHADMRSRLEGVIPDILKRAVERGVERATEAPENLKSFVGELKIPKEIAHYLLSQVDETKNGLFRVVAKEMGDFLKNTNLAGELQKVLTSVQFEVNTTIRFRPNDGPRDGKAEKASAKGQGDSSAEPAEGREKSGSDPHAHENDEPPPSDRPSSVPGERKRGRSD